MKKTVCSIVILVFSALMMNAQEISPYLFGQNHWMEQGDEGGRPGYISQLWPAVEASGVKMIRIGGIGYENNFPDRVTLNSMLDSIRGIGAEPLLQVPRDMSDADVTKLVKDYKYSKGKGVRYYSIGNEPICNRPEEIDKVYNYLIRLAPVMKSADPTIKILVFDECTFMKEAYAALCGGRLDMTGKDKKGNWMIDGFAFHNYPNGRIFDRNDVVFSGPAKIERQIIDLLEMMDQANKLHGRTGDAKLTWGLTETNITYMNPDREISGYGNPSFLGGQFIAEIYGLGMQYGALTVDPWCINETDRIRSDFGYIGLPSEFYPRSSYYHTQLMAKNMKGKFLPTSSSNSYVKTIGSLSEDEICLMIMNSDISQDFDYEISLNDHFVSAKALHIVADINVDKTISGNIPNQTTILYVLNRSGNVIKTYTYGLQHNLKYLPPEERYYKSPDAFTQNKRIGRAVNIIGYDPFWKSMENARFQAEHFKIIKDGGFSAVRVNIHPFRFMDKEDNYQLPPSWFDKLDWVLENALAQDLMVILDFHEFNSMAENPEEKKEIFLSFWEQLAPHCKYLPSNVVFELLNEPNRKLTPELWNVFLKEALAIVRKTNPDRTVIIGPGYWNQIPHLKELELPEDDRNIIVTIHYYSPHSFTHQGAPWAGEEAQSWIGKPWGSEEDKAAVRADFQVAKDWSVKYKRPIFLGEFGVYDAAKMEYRVAYTSYVARLAEELGFSWAYWQFDSDFIVYDIDKHSWNEPIHRALIPSRR